MFNIESLFNGETGCACVIRINRIEETSEGTRVYYKEHNRMVEDFFIYDDKKYGLFNEFMKNGTLNDLVGNRYRLIITKHNISEAEKDSCIYYDDNTAIKIEDIAFATSLYDLIIEAVNNNCFDSEEVQKFLKENDITDNFEISYNCELPLKDRKVINEKNYTETYYSLKYEDYCNDFRYLTIHSGDKHIEVYDEDWYDVVQKGIITISCIGDGYIYAVTESGTKIEIEDDHLHEKEDIEEFLGGHEVEWIEGKKVNINHTASHCIDDTGSGFHDFWFDKFEILD
ncbi:MAG: hypothetical protein PUH54_00860 [Oscillospiraceae bacterium]|nr:hypothetical protein [Oscillospiraceae bacterium]